MRTLVGILIIALVFTACASDSEQSQEATDMEKIALVCEDMGEVDYIPNYSVFLVAGESKVKLAVITACEVIPPDQYAEFDIPAEALAAVGGYYAGAGDYLYAERVADKVTIFQGMMDEMQEEPGFGYAPIAVYENGEVTLVMD